MTVGAQTPFDRLVRAVDRWAGTRPDQDVLAQIGDGEHEPENVRWTRFLPPDRFRRAVMACDLLVAHAGTGSLMTAGEYGKPVLLLPRRAELGETRNEHQRATAKRFEGRPGVTVAWDEEELVRRLDRQDDLSALATVAGGAEEALIAKIREFVWMGRP